MPDCPYHGGPTPCRSCEAKRMGAFARGVCPYHGGPKPCAECAAAGMGAFNQGPSTAYVPPHRRRGAPVQRVRSYPHYRQFSQMSCSVEAIRMAHDTLAGSGAERGELKHYMEMRGVFTVQEGAYFQALDRVFDWLGVPCALARGGFDAVARALAEGNLVLMEVRTGDGGGHVLVIDSLLGHEGGVYRFQIRDPGGFNVETVDSNDPRLKRATGYFWKLG